MVGTVEEGGGCFIDEECLDGDGAGSCSAAENQCGTCQVNPIILDANLGESCEEADCAAGLECNNDSICEAARESGGAGSNCSSDGPTDVFGGCDRTANLVCVDDVCTEANFTRSAGTDCGSNGTMCEGDLVCPINSGGRSTQCVAPKAAGQNCFEVEGDVYTLTACVTTAFCDFETGQCVAKKADGESCDQDDHCVSDNCDEMSEQCSAPANEPAWQGCD